MYIYIHTYFHIDTKEVEVERRDSWKAVKVKILSEFAIRPTEGAIQRHIFTDNATVIDKSYHRKKVSTRFILELKTSLQSQKNAGGLEVMYMYVYNHIYILCILNMVLE
jgi:hypothetical protein